jgi:tRNA pseudouridine13 synthase
MLDWTLPYLTEDLPGVGGVTRQEIEDFIVEEVPAYEPCGEGEHTFFRVRKRDVPSMALLKEIARKLSVSRRKISCAGLKDARAVAEQTFSAHFVPPERILALELENAEVLWAKLHTNKLRTGHLRGNRFTLRLREVVPDAAERAEAITQVLLARGVPNGYGRQRFGNYGDNAEIGLLLLRDDQAGLAEHGLRRYPSRRMRRFFISALQSALFNQVLARRIQAGTMDDLLLGDIAKKEDTGGLFIVEDVAVERPRVTAWEISATGPIYGYKMFAPHDEAAALEAEILAAANLTPEEFRSVRAKGTRRPLRYYPDGLSYQMEDEQTLVVSFFAPKGAYATLLLRELMKADVDLGEDDEDEGE